MGSTRDFRHDTRHEGEYVLVELDGDATKRLLRMVGNDHVVHGLAIASHELTLDLHAVALLRRANDA